jgi:hypothetical protein
VIAYLGVKAGHIDATLASVVIFAFVLTSLATPLLFNLSRTLPMRLGPLLARLGFAGPEEGRASIHGHGLNEIVILGFHRVAASLLQDVSRQHPELLPSILVIDVNVRTHAAVRELGVRVRYGDAGSPETLRHAGVEQAKLVVCTVPDELLRGTSNQAIVRAIRGIAKEPVVLACASRAADVDRSTPRARATCSCRPPRPPTACSAPAWPPWPASSTTSARRARLRMGRCRRGRMWTGCPCSSSPAHVIVVTSTATHWNPPWTSVE